MSINKIDWSSVRSSRGSEGGLVLQGGDGSDIKLSSGSIKGESRLGTFEVALSAIKSLDPQNKTPRAQTASRPACKVVFKDVTTASFNVVELEGKVDCYDSTYQGCVEVASKNLLFWIPKTDIVNQDLSIKDGKMEMMVAGRRTQFDAGKLTFNLKNAILDLKGDGSQLVSLEPSEKKTSPLAVNAGSTPLLVKLSDGVEQTFVATRVRFVNYPTTGWTGSYFSSEWPFQWWPSDTLEVIKNDDSHLEIKIDKISAIQVMRTYQDRQLRITSRTGNALEVRHFYRILNEERKHGPYEWTREKEGLLLDMPDKIGVVIPFYAVAAVEFGNKAN
jgi:hypothetical protein